MFVENLIKETERLLEEASLKELIKLWNKIFPEEKISLTTANEYSEDIVDELRFMIIDEIQDTGIEQLIEIHNQIAEDKISEEDIYSEFDSLNGSEEENEDE